ncbi:hypothetical protein AFEL58S_03399 [Afipia felis]
MNQYSIKYGLAGIFSTATFLLPTVLVAQDENLLPRQYFQKYLEQQQRAAEENKSSNARRYWIDIAEQVKTRRRGLTGKQDSEISWKLSETRDRLTQSRTLTSTAFVEDGGNQLRVEFTCSSFKKQLQILLTDVSPSTNGMPDTSQNLANISMVFDPPALDGQRNQIRNTKMPFNGKTIIATGLNSNSWGISLCGEDAGGAGYVFNAAYCSATGLKNGPRDIKDWDWIRYPWLDFDEVRMSMQIDWGSDSHGSRTPDRGRPGYLDRLDEWHSYRCVRSPKRRVCLGLLRFGAKWHGRGRARIFRPSSRMAGILESAGQGRAVQPFKPFSRIPISDSSRRYHRPCRRCCVRRPPRSGGCCGPWCRP